MHVYNRGAGRLAHAHYSSAWEKVDKGVDEFHSKWGETIEDFADGEDDLTDYESDPEERVQKKVKKSLSTEIFSKVCELNKCQYSP